MAKNIQLIEEIRFSTGIFQDHETLNDNKNIFLGVRSLNTKC